MKKSIAVLSLSLASLLGLAACAPAVEAPVASRDSASASASASPSASSSASPSARSESSSSPSSKPTSSASGRATASSDTTQGASSAVGADEMQYKARKHYETYYQKIAEAEKDPAVVKGENADGKTYILEKDKLAMVVGKNNEYIIFHQHDGNWSRLRPNGELELTYSDGAWVRVMPDGERIAVKASGNTNIAYHQGDVSEDIITSLKTPEVPAQVEGFASVPQKPVKPKKLGTVVGTK